MINIKNIGTFILILVVGYVVYKYLFNKSKIYPTSVISKTGTNHGQTADKAQTNHRQTRDTHHRQHRQTTDKPQTNHRQHR